MPMVKNGEKRKSVFTCPPLQRPNGLHSLFIVEFILLACQRFHDSDDVGSPFSAEMEYGILGSVAFCWKRHAFHILQSSNVKVSRIYQSRKSHVHNSRRSIYRSGEQMRRSSPAIMTQGLNDDDGVHAQAEPNEGTHYSRWESERGASQRKMPFFAVPVVGFFRPRPVRTNLGERVSFSNNGTEDSDYGTNTTKKSAKERWALLRKHVSNESFHIQGALKQSQRRKSDLHFDDVDLPFEFSLLDCFLALAAYLLISIIAFSFIFEHWTVIDSMYFAVVTFTTTGYGDISPSTIGGKLFCVLFALSGVAVLAIALGVVGSKIVEAEISSMNAAETEIVKDVAAVFRRASSRAEKQKGFADSHRTSSKESSSFSYLTEYDDPTQSLRDRFDAIAHPCIGTRRWCFNFFGLLGRYLPALAPLFLGSFIIGHFEGWDWEDTIYYCVVTTTTIGYGDVTPQRQWTKLFAVLFIPLAVGAMGHFLGTVANFIMDQRIRVHHKRLWRHELTLEDLRAMSTSPDGTVTEIDFLVFMLQAMKKVDSDLIEKIREHFHNLDLTHSGTLEREDLELMAKRKLRTAHCKLDLAKYKSKLLRQGSSLAQASFDEDAALV